MWLSFARFGPEWATFPTIIAMLAVAVLILVRLEASGPLPRGFADWCAFALFGLYGGWLTTAVFANVTEIALDLGFGFFGLSLEYWAVAALVAGTALACRIAFAARNLFYAAAILWALAAIAAANAPERRWAVLSACLLGAAAIVLATIAAWRHEQPAPPAAAVRNRPLAAPRSSR